MLCGASHMGKSYLARTVLKAEYGVMYRQIDNLYTNAVIAAGMVRAEPHTLDEADPVERRVQRAEELHDARRRARDRRWPDDETKDAFFAAYRQQIEDALREGHESGVLVAFEGGTLRHDLEAGMVASEAHKILGERVRVVRATVVVSYGRWLVNRIQRMANSGREQIPLRVLTQDAYKRAVKGARPRVATADVEDFRVKSAATVRQLMADLGHPPLPASSVPSLHLTEDPNQAGFEPGGAQGAS